MKQVEVPAENLQGGHFLAQVRRRKRLDRIGCGLWLVGMLAAVVLVASFVPAPPTAPRFLGAGNNTPRNGGTFVFHHVVNVRSLELHTSYDEVSQMATHLMFDTLLDYDDDANLVPLLARDMPRVSEDGRVFRFELKQGVLFHPFPGAPNGRELTAEDLRWSMERMLAKDTASPGFAFYSSLLGAPDFHEGRSNSVPGIRVIGRYGIEFELTEPDQTFLNALAMHFAAPVPHENYEYWGRDILFHPVGTGPFRFVRWERGVELRFRRFERYHAPRPRADELVFLENVARDLAARRLRSGDLDAIHRLTPSDFRFFTHSDSWRPYRVERPAGSTYGVIFNTELAPFDNVHIRRALAAAIDREGWVRARGRGRFVPAGGLIPPSVPGYDAHMQGAQHFDLALAREELRLAGHPNGLTQPVTVWFPGTDETNRAYAELLAHDWAQIGVRMTARFTSFATFLTEAGKPRTVQASFSGWNLDFPDPHNFLMILSSEMATSENSQNKSFYRDAELDRLIAQGKRMTDRQARLDVYRAANRRVAEQAPWAFVLHPLKVEVWQPYVHGYRPHPVVSQSYRNVWLDLPRRRR